MERSVEKINNIQIARECAITAQEELENLVKELEFRVSRIQTLLKEIEVQLK